MERLFAPLGLDWRPVSARLTTRLRILWAAFLVPLTAVLTAAALLVPTLPWVPWALLAAGVLALLLGMVYAGRRTRAWGYAERAEDLYIRHGVLVRNLVAVPYGRMQFVDVTAGPLERALGLAEVELHTATPGTRARIPGLDPEEAARLRDRLTALGQAQAAGL
ncbi:MAG TPA: PH domain-containing protein [Nocardioidaceae bacterium]|nr:PH domain-containing protein [Nocardioidaceae bacterium]